MTVLYAPADVVTAVLRFLRGYGYDARASVPLDAPARTVHVSRVGGSPATPKTEHATVLIEAWHTNQKDSFLFARELWARFAVISQDDQDAFPGIVCYRAVPGLPVEYPDADRQRLVRHQFTVDMHVEFDTLTISEKVNE